jgi:S1-C subfamily serine protease
MNKIFPLLVTLSFVVSGLACKIPASLSQLEMTSIPGKPTVTFQAVATPTILPDNGTVITTDLHQQEDLLVALYEEVNPGVVSIQTLTEQGGAQGSGFVFDKDGHIVTNFHVVEGASELVINFVSGIKVRGKVIGTDPDSDLAVIKVDVPPENLFPIELGDSDQLKVGQTVIAIGNPYGLSSTMTVGIVSAKGRTLDSLRQSENGRLFSAGDIIQTDASINPGNSGGPLLNINGQIIGINRAIRTAGVTTLGEPITTGIGFAISVNIVKHVVPSLIVNGKYDYPYLGLTAREEVGLLEQETLNLPQNTGAYILEIVAGGPADQAGLRGGSRSTEIPGLEAGGDLIIAIDNRPIRVFGELLSYMMTTKNPGDKIILTVLRDGKQEEIEVTLGKRP